MQIHSLNLEKKSIDMAENSTVTSEIIFSEIKREKKKVITEN